MDFRFTSEEEAFRTEVHDFIEKDCPKELRGGDVSFFEQAGNLFAWRKKVAQKGWVAPAWPKEYGGAGMSIMEQFIYSMETARMRAPAPIFIGALAVAVIGPTIIIYGSEEQKKKHIPKILAGGEMRGWYQAVTTLDIERSTSGSAVGQQQTVEDLIKFARDNQSDGVVRIKSDPALRTELAERYLETEVAMSLSARVVSMQAKGMIPNYEASAVKLYSMELNQRIANTGVRLMGLYGPLARGSRLSPMKGRMSYSYIRNVANTIEGGTSEVQRNIVAQRGLGLPRE